MRSAPSRSGALRILALITVTVVGVLLAAPSGPIGAQIFETTTTADEEPPDDDTTTTTEDDGGIIPLPDDTTTTTELDEETTTTEEETTTSVDDRPTTSEEETTTSLLPTPTFGGPIAPGATSSSTQPTGDGGGNGLSLGTVVFLTVSAMLVAAGLLTWITWRIWDRTRPRLPEGAVPAPPWHRRVADYLRI